MRLRPKSAAGSALELVVIVAVALGLALLIQAFLVKPYRIPSGSMEPTLQVGQRVLVNRVGEHLGDPDVGDVVVFHPPIGATSGDGETCGDANQGRLHGQPCGRPLPRRSDQNFIKRVVAGPGDTIAIVNGRVVRNGRLQKEPFIRPCSPGDDCDFRTPIKVPPGDYFMMGDNRGQSDDSRFWGPVPKGWIIGSAFFTYWPPGRIGFL